MAALVAGVQYGLSSHSNFHENKSLIFVKLTDSAQRAIEDFLRNRNKTSQNPTIQFLGNEGEGYLSHLCLGLSCLMS
ncbi:RNA polymerase II elongation factor Ell [Apis mellifera carnica]|nr:RNA polymerase II elongation factor Ell [Apis mellifera carnica]